MLFIWRANDINKHFDKMPTFLISNSLPIHMQHQPIYQSGSNEVACRILSNNFHCFVVTVSVSWMSCFPFTSFPFPKNESQEKNSVFLFNKFARKFFIFTSADSKTNVVGIHVMYCCRDDLSIKKCHKWLSVDSFWRDQERSSESV